MSVIKPSRALTPNLKAALLVVIGMMMISSNDAIMKLSSSEMGVGQLLFVRGLLALIIFCGFLKLRGLPLFPAGLFLKWNLIRAACECLATLAFILSLTLMPIGIASTLLWTAPIFVTIAAATVLKESVSWRRWAAVFVGFSGALLITNPLGAEFSVVMLLPIVSAAFVCARDLTTRYIDPDLSSLYVLLATLVLVVLVGLGMALINWNPVTPTRVGWLLVCALLLSGGFLCQINAVRLADLSFIAPFSYTGILVALFYGYVIWDELPNMRSLIGIVLIVASGIYILVASKKNQIKKLQQHI